MTTAPFRTASTCWLALHKARNHRPIALTIRELLDATRAQAGFALWQAGDQVLANVLRLLQLARNFEESGGLSFRGFVDHLSTLAETAAHSEQPLIEDGVEGVRLMTVHKAKGLEFPVVILCDITCISSMGASRHVDPERGIFAVRFAGGSPWELLDHEQAESERDAAESPEAPLRGRHPRPRHPGRSRRRRQAADRTGGWRRFCPRSTHQSKSYPIPDGGAERPALHGRRMRDRATRRAPTSCPVKVSVPDCTNRRSADTKSSGGIPINSSSRPRRNRDYAAIGSLQAKPDEGPTQGEREHQSWSEKKSALLEQGSSESYHATSVSRLVEEEAAPPKGADSVEIAEVTGRDPQRPGGKRFGSLVHELLARSPWKRRETWTWMMSPRSASSLARMLDATEPERDAAVATVIRALSHPILEQAREPPSAIGRRR